VTVFKLEKQKGTKKKNNCAMWRMADGLTVLSFFFHILVGLFAQERTFRFWTAAATDATTRDGHGEKRRQSAGGLCTAPLALSAFATSFRRFFFFFAGVCVVDALAAGALSYCLADKEADPPLLGLLGVCLSRLSLFCSFCDFFGRVRVS